MHRECDRISEDSRTAGQPAASSEMPAGLFCVTGGFSLGLFLDHCTVGKVAIGSDP